MEKENSNEMQNELIRNLQNEKKYFASVLSHDLRSPLSSIILLVSYLKTKDKQSEIGSYLELIEQSARKELDMMTTLLSLMRTESFNADNLEDVKLRDMAELLINKIETQLSVKDIQVNLDIPADLTINIDVQAFKLVFQNLIQHALYQSDKGQNIEIKSTENEDQVIIGIGFMSQGFGKVNPELLFDSSHLASTNGKKAFPDCIDLYFCNKIISNCNGTIHVYADETGPACNLILTLERWIPKITA